MDPFFNTTSSSLNMWGFAPPEAMDIDDDVSTYDQVNVDELFTSLQNETEEIFKTVELVPENKIISRFIDIFSPVKTNIQFFNSSGKCLHANRVSTKGPTSFILSQFPYPPFADKNFFQHDSRELFWNLCFDKSLLIIDLTNEDDFQKDLMMSPYYPQYDDQTVRFGDYTVTRFNGFYEGLTPQSTYTITYEGESKEVTRFHYAYWQDQSATQCENLLHLYSKLDAFLSKTPTTPIIHCRAGVGRSGTFTVGYSLYQLFKQGKLTKENSISKLKELILRGRCERGRYFVQSQEQLKMLIELTAQLLTSK